MFDNGQQHMVSLWGGTGLNYGPDRERILTYSQTAERFKGIAETAGVDIFLSNHPSIDGSRERFPAMLTRKKSEPHPFVIGKQQALKAFDMLNKCTYAQVLRIDESARN